MDFLELSAVPALVAALLAERYPPPAPCWALVVDAYGRALAGIDPLAVSTVSEPLRLAARTFQLRLHKAAGAMQQVAPRDLAVVLMWHTERRRKMHCGMLVAGKVLHAGDDGVPLYQDLASLRSTYPVLEYWGYPA